MVEDVIYSVIENPPPYEGLSLLLLAFFGYVVFVIVVVKKRGLVPIKSNFWLAALIFFVLFFMPIGAWLNYKEQRGFYESLMKEDILTIDDYLVGTIYSSSSVDTLVFKDGDRLRAINSGLCFDFSKVSFDLRSSELNISAKYVRRYIKDEVGSSVCFVEVVIIK